MRIYSRPLWFLIRVYEKFLQGWVNGAASYIRRISTKTFVCRMHVAIVSIQITHKYVIYLNTDRYPKLEVSVFGIVSCLTQD